MSFFGALAIIGFGLVHLVLGVLLLVTALRAVQGEIIPRSRIAGAGPANMALAVLGGAGWTLLVALFCFLVASRFAQMLFT